MARTLEQLCEDLQRKTQVLSHVATTVAAEEMVLLALQQIEIEIQPDETDETEIQADEGEKKAEAPKGPKEYAADWLKNAKTVIRVGGRFASKAASDAAEATEQAAYNTAKSAQEAGAKAGQAVGKKAGELASNLKVTIPAVSADATAKIKEAWDAPSFKTSRANLRKKLDGYGTDAKAGFDAAVTSINESRKNLTPANVGKASMKMLDDIQMAAKVAKDSPEDVIAGGIAYAQMAMASALSIVDKEKGTKLAESASKELDYAAGKLGANKKHHQEMIATGKETAASAIVMQKTQDLSVEIGKMKSKVANSELGKAVHEIADSKEFKDMQDAIGTAVTSGKGVAKDAYDKARESAQKHFDEAKTAGADAKVQAQKMINDVIASVQSGEAGPAVVAATVPYIKLLATKMGAEPKTVDAALTDIADTVKTVSGNAGDQLKAVSTTINAKVGQLEGNRQQGMKEGNMKDAASASKASLDSAHKAAQDAKRDVEKAQKALMNDKDLKKQEGFPDAKRQEKRSDLGDKLNNAQARYEQAQAKEKDADYVYKSAKNESDKTSSETAYNGPLKDTSLKQASKQKFLEDRASAGKTAKESVDARNTELAKSREGTNALRQEGKAEAATKAAEQARTASEKAAKAKEAKEAAQKAQAETAAARQEKAAKENARNSEYDKEAKRAEAYERGLEERATALEKAAEAEKKRKEQAKKKSKAGWPTGSSGRTGADSPVGAYA